jgi:hypothetical protein
VLRQFIAQQQPALPVDVSNHVVSIDGGLLFTPPFATIVDIGSSIRYSIGTISRDFDSAGVGVFSGGYNFIGASDVAAFTATGDQRGTLAAPRLLLSVGRLGYNGGLTPTLKLRDDSPARSKVPLAFPVRAQNDHVWDRTADIGAWGGAANVPPAAQDLVFEMLEEGTLTLTASDLMKGVSDANGDEVFLARTDFSKLSAAPVVTQRTRPALVATGSHRLMDNTGTSFERMTYRPAKDFAGEEKFTFVVSDGYVEKSVTATIRVRNVNDAPTLGPRPAVVRNEDAGPVSIPGWANFTSGPANESHQHPLAYSVVAVSNPALFEVLPTVAPGGTLTFTPARNAHGQATFDLQVQDDGGTADGGADRSAPTRYAITILPVNDAPEVTVPGAQTGYENVPLELPGITVADVDAARGTGQVEVTLQVERGTLTLGQTAGLTFTDGGDGSGSMRFRGAIADVNAALAGLRFVLAGASGTVTLNVTVNDLGNTGDGGPSIVAQQVVINVLSAEEQGLPHLANGNGGGADQPLGEPQHDGRPAPGAAGSPEEQYVTALYRDVLGRAPDAAGLAFWVGGLQSGWTRQQVAQGFWESAEHRGLQVDSFYAAYLGRHADPAGRAAHVNALLAGTPEDVVRAGFLTSAEYLGRHPDAASFVRALYADVLGRTAAADEVANWVGRLSQDGLSQQAVALAFLTSAEEDAASLDALYADLLGRTASAVEHGWWLSRMQGGQVGGGQAAVGFLASDEYFARGGEW